MKIGKRAESNKVRATNPDKNNSKKNILIMLIIAVTAVMILWVYSMGKKAESTVSVVMYAQDIYKNQVITEDMLKEYKMLTGEFEKYAADGSNGNKVRRIVLWEERNKMINTFAAYSLHQETIAMIKDVVNSRIDNSDSVLYSFPGKHIIDLDVAEGQLQTFKTFLQPGDKINITAVFTSSEKDENGEDVELFREETVFKDIMIADLLNQQGSSILDIYASYNEKTVYQQANLDASDAFKDSVTPKSMLVALTPEEEVLYYQYLARDGVEFKISLPQRSE